MDFGNKLAQSKGPPDLERLKFEEPALYRARKVKMAAMLEESKKRRGLLVDVRPSSEVSLQVWYFGLYLQLA